VLIVTKMFKLCSINDDNFSHISFLNVMIFFMDQVK